MRCVFRVEELKGKDKMNVGKKSVEKEDQKKKEGGEKSQEVEILN